MINNDYLTATVRNCNGLKQWLLLIFAVVSISVHAQTISPDAQEYAPMSTATFTGSGFWPNENVVLRVKNLTQPCHTTLSDSSYAPWTVAADANGEFITSWTVCNCSGDSLR